MQQKAASVASANVSAAGGRDHLPALLEAEEDRASMSDHRRRGGENPDERAADPEPERRSGEALREVEQRDRDSERAPVDAEDVRGADVPAPLRADVLATNEPWHPVAERQRSEQVRDADCEQIVSSRSDRDPLTRIPVAEDP